MKLSQISKIGHVTYELTMLDSNPTLWLYDLDANYPLDAELISMCVNKSDKRAAKKGKKNAYWMSVGKLEDADAAVKLGLEETEKKKAERMKAKADASSPKGKKENGKGKQAKKTSSSPKGKKDEPAAESSQALKELETRLAALEAEISPDAVQATIDEATAKAVETALAAAIPAITDAVIKAISVGDAAKAKAKKTTAQSPKGTADKKPSKKSTKTA